MKAKVLTANRLGDGRCVWYASNGCWVETFDGAAIAADAEALDAFQAEGQRAAAANEVIDVNLIDVDAGQGAPRPVRLRERIRAEGPTIDFEPGTDETVAPAQRRPVAA